LWVHFNFKSFWGKFFLKIIIPFLTFHERWIALVYFKIEALLFFVWKKSHSLRDWRYAFSLSENSREFRVYFTSSMIDLFGKKGV
jgi:hypothetical protein